MRFRWLAVLGLASVLATEVSADTILFSTNATPDGLMAMGSRPGLAGKIETEAADDFFTTSPVQITSATFTGLIVSTTGGQPSIGDVVVELYHIFPLDSNVNRTSGPPTFSTPQVPTRVNSPSDMEFDSRDLAAGKLTVSTQTITTNFTALNSVLNGIRPVPNQTTDGPVTGTEVKFTVNFTTPFTLPANDHDFFVPQVQVTGGEFYWLSSARPITTAAGGTPFPTGVTDLQAWIRNDPSLAPDWLRVGTDIVGGATPPTFNGTFSLSGAVVPEPSSWVMAATATLAGLAGAFRAKRTGTAGPARI
jgi:hypothetical protein